MCNNIFLGAKKGGTIIRGGTIFGGNTVFDNVFTFGGFYGPGSTVDLTREMIMKPQNCSMTKVTCCFFFRWEGVSQNSLNNRRGMRTCWSVSRPCINQTQVISTQV